MQVIELTARVSKAANFGHALSEQLLIAREVVAHQVAAPWIEEGSRMLASATLGEVVDDRLHLFECPRAISPEISALSLPLSRTEHRDRCLVSVQHAMLQDLLFQRVN